MNHLMGSDLTNIRRPYSKHTMDRSINVEISVVLSIRWLSDKLPSMDRWACSLVWSVVVSIPKSAEWSNPQLPKQNAYCIAHTLVL